MLRLASLLGLTAGLAGMALTIPTSAQACGGCFAVASGQPSVVTAHRMVISVNDQETTLWDQFEYVGDPEEFVWVLPVSGGEDVEIGLADQAFFQHLASETQVFLQGPVLSRGGSGFGCSADAGAATGMESPNVTVYSSEVVGPYETVVIGSEDAGSLRGWLTENGFFIPESLGPTIAHYVDQGMSFAVLRLSQNAGVSQIQPVRVTTPGAHVTFPLKMVAAGISDSVSLELFIIAEGRWEAQNFVNAVITEEELHYDAAAGIFNYDALAEDHLGWNRGRTWLTEYANTIRNPRDPDVEGDWMVATRHLASDPVVTRMRAELPADALGVDLVLQASLDPIFPSTFVVTNLVNAESETVTTGNRSPIPFFFLLAGIAAFLLGWGRKKTGMRVAESRIHQ